jgi:hypothetical protein
MGMVSLVHPFMDNNPNRKSLIYLYFLSISQLLSSCADNKPSVAGLSLIGFSPDDATLITPEYASAAWLFLAGSGR